MDLPTNHRYTSYYLPRWWKHPAMRWYRRLKVWWWSKRGFASYQRAVSWQHARIPYGKERFYHEGMAIMTVRRVRQRRYILCTAKQSDYALDQFLN